ncbi:hypothetical protein [Nonomuraea sp. NPDC049709]|uniref:glycosyltransferase n=1 Tax=Nonomuraea sp. NPDC049709 TaxID=3154736 RepID=UPI003414F5C0
MRVLIVGVGTRGDVAPCTGLGVRLRDAGHGVAVAAYSRQVTDGMLEAMGVPSMGVHLQPVEPAGDFPPAISAFGRSLGRWGNRTAGRLAFPVPSPAHSGAARKLRALLGSPPMTSRAVYRRREATGRSVFHGYSPLVLPRPADWCEGLEVAGYWWPERPPGWAPDAPLGDFLDAGPPPVLIGSGSQTAGRADHLTGLAGRADHLTGLAVRALREAELRGALRTGAPGLIEDRVLGVGDVRHLTPEHLTPERLATALRAAVTDPSYRRRAAELGDRIPVEDGAAAVASAVDKQAA